MRRVIVDSMYVEYGIGENLVIGTVHSAETYMVQRGDVASLRQAIDELFPVAPRELSNPRHAEPARYARCPGCGDHGDVTHVVACVMLRAGLSRTVNYWKGANAVIGVVMKQLARRGVVDWSRVTRAVAIHR